MTAPPFLFLLGAGGDDDGPFREFVLSRLADAHAVVLVGPQVPGWATPYLAGHIDADLTDAHESAAAVKAFTADNDVAGVMTYMERHVLACAQLAQQLGLPAGSPESMAACRDKAVTRQLLARHHVPSARALEARDAGEAVGHAGSIGYPVVVKPRAMAGSAGVVRADTPAEVRAAFELASREAEAGSAQYGAAGVLVEEWLDGQEISVETAVLGSGEVRILAVTRKLPAPAGTTQEYGHVVAAADPLLTDAALAHVIQGAVQALGLTRAVLCVEVMLTASGPRIVEVNGRVGGDLLPLLVHHALGIDLPQVAAALATGTPPQLEPTRHAAAAIRFAYPETTGVLERNAFPPGINALPFVERAVITKKSGSRVFAPPRATLADRLAHWVVTAESAVDCLQLLDEVAGHLDIAVVAPTHIASCTR
ncbi:ATP-grasp domain-containing protein [Streptomyces olivaceus]|uniref:ATP-grasp domain-containing protein n=1 Tax=Streptomyces olivaceus TaxID=47716 RepID=UPI0022EE6C9E|nr:ATP-grasp domain-containing protein [Streptomyces olivaceus]GHI98000.1 carboxylase [Streptomyces olivaceus]